MNENEIIISELRKEVERICEQNESIRQTHIRAEVVAEILKDYKLKVAEIKHEFDECKNELCIRCGSYMNAHLGACDGCRWKKDARYDNE